MEGTTYCPTGLPFQVEVAVETGIDPGALTRIEAIVKKHMHKIEDCADCQIRANAEEVANRNGQCKDVRVFLAIIEAPAIKMSWMLIEWFLGHRF